MERLADDLFHDFHYSPDLKEHLLHICEVLGIVCKAPIERVAHRWLSSYDVTCRNIEMMDALTAFCFTWVDAGKQREYESIVHDIISKRDPTKSKLSANKKHLDNIRGKLKQKQRTPLGLSRKKRIAELIFNQRQLTLAYMHLYCSVLLMFKSFVLTLEQKEPIVHKAHDEMTDLLEVS